MNDGSNFSELLNQIEEHPGTRAHRSWNALTHVHSIMTVNAAELLAMVGALESNENNLALNYVSNTGPQERVEAIYRELIRRLHNYLASVVTLIDHTRKLTNTYDGTPTLPEYLRRLEIAKEGGVGLFVSKLRNYMLHVGIPSVGVTFQWSREAGSSVLVYTDRDKALQWKDWQAGARTYLQAQEQYIPIRRIITEYADSIGSLYDWLYAQFEVLHGTEIDEVNRLIVRSRSPHHPTVEQLPRTPQGR